MEPLFFDPHLVKKPWGGERLRTQYGKGLSMRDLIGESWELSAEREGASVVRNGAFVGKTLASLYRNHPQLFGGISSQFPFTIKLIDAKGPLSVQLHGRVAPMIHADQCEAWYIVKAQPGASVVLGADIENPKELRHAIMSNTLDRHLNRIEVNAGDVVYIPTGTLHSIGAGILLFEIRQPNMATFRAYDWGRRRKLNVDECCSLYRSDAPYGKVDPSLCPDGTKLLLNCDCFSLELIQAKGGNTQMACETFLAYTALEEGQIEMGATYPYHAGDTFLIPAGSVRFTLRGGVLIKARLPYGDIARIASSFSASPAYGYEAAE